MSEEAEDRPESAWLLEPPATGEIHLQIAVGSEVELSAEARASLDRVLEILNGPEEGEAQGFRVCTIGPCSDYQACTPKGGCAVLETGTCAAFFHCKITP